MSMKINIEAVDSTMKSLPPVTTAKARFDNAGGHEETDPIERLRFFCSKAMSGQDWLDVEPFFDAPIAEPGTLAAKLAELEGQTENLLSACHRLALELECLLLDTKDSALVSRWWDSAMEALDDWHKAKDLVFAEQPMNAQQAGPVRPKVSFIPSVENMPMARSIDDEMMDVVDGLGALEPVDPRALKHLLVYAPKTDPVRLTRVDIEKAFAQAGLKPEDYREDGEILPLVVAIESAALRKNGIEVAE